jgi:hypothetical protein
MTDPTIHSRSYFVDEAGDGNLFDAKGRVIVGSEGCSNYFLLGMLDILDPAALGRGLTDLRLTLLADPYFRKVPSMQPDGRKTAHSGRLRRTAGRRLLFVGITAILRTPRGSLPGVFVAGVSPGARSR